MKVHSPKEVLADGCMSTPEVRESCYYDMEWWVRETVLIRHSFRVGICSREFHPPTTDGSGLRNRSRSYLPLSTLYSGALTTSRIRFI